MLPCPDVSIPLRSCGLLLVPLLLANFGLAPLLPAAFRADVTVPVALIVIETLGRALVFVLPFFMPLPPESPARRKQLAWFCATAGLYLASWFPLIVPALADWSRHAAVFLAPAYTPAGWLVVMSRLGQRVTFWPTYRPWLFVVGSAVFLAAHIWHVWLIFGEHS